MKKNTVLNQLKKNKSNLNSIAKSYIGEKSELKIIWNNQKKQIDKQNRHILIVDIIISLFFIIALFFVSNMLDEEFILLYYFSKVSFIFSIIYCISGCISDYKKNKMETFEEFCLKKIKYEKSNCLEELKLTKLQLKPLYEALSKSYGDDLLLIKIEELKDHRKCEEEIGNYLLLERLYLDAIKYEELKLSNEYNKNKKQINSILK